MYAQYIYQTVISLWTFRLSSFVRVCVCARVCVSLCVVLGCGGWAGQGNSPRPGPTGEVDFPPGGAGGHLNKDMFGFSRNGPTWQEIEQFAIDVVSRITDKREQKDSQTLGVILVCRTGTMRSVAVSLLAEFNVCVYLKLYLLSLDTSCY